MTRAECITAVAELLAGLQVPVSMNMPLGTATEPFHELHVALKGFGYATAEEYEAALEVILG